MSESFKPQPTPESRTDTAQMFEPAQLATDFTQQADLTTNQELAKLYHQNAANLVALTPGDHSRIILVNHHQANELPQAIDALAASVTAPYDKANYGTLTQLLDAAANNPQLAEQLGIDVSQVNFTGNMLPSGQPEKNAKYATITNPWKDRRLVYNHPDSPTAGMYDPNQAALALIYVEPQSDTKAMPVDIPTNPPLEPKPK